MPITSINSFTRRAALRLPLSIVGAAMLSQPLRALAHGDHNLITVWKNPDCGCCREWIAHLRTNGFQVASKDVEDTTPIRRQLNFPEKYGACHTAVLGDYVIEGHVPAPELKRLLRERPSARGLAVPGMPAGSPGMEVGKTRDAYNVLLVLADGSSRIYQSYPPKSPT